MPGNPRIRHRRRTQPQPQILAVRIVKRINRHNHLGRRRKRSRKITSRRVLRTWVIPRPHILRAKRATRDAGLVRRVGEPSHTGAVKDRVGPRVCVDGETCVVDVAGVHLDAPVLVLVHVEGLQPGDDFGSGLEGRGEVDAFGVLEARLVPGSDFLGVEDAGLHVVEAGALLEEGHGGRVEGGVCPALDGGLELLSVGVAGCRGDADVGSGADVKRSEAQGQLRHSIVLFLEVDGLVCVGLWFVPRTDLHGVELPSVKGIGWVAELGVLLIQSRQTIVAFGALAIGGPASREVVQHDAVWIKVCRLGIFQGVEREHVLVNLGLVPVVGRSAKVLVYLVLVPWDACVWALMFMDSAEGVAKLVENDGADFAFSLVVVDPSQVHGWTFLGAEPGTVCSQVGPRSQTRVEGDVNIHFSRINKGELDVGVLRPLWGVLFDLILHCL